MIIRYRIAAFSLNPDQTEVCPRRAQISILSIKDNNPVPLLSNSVSKSRADNPCANY